MAAGRHALLWLCIFACLLGGFAAHVHALVPRADRVINAVADANKAGHRLRALRFQVNLRIGEGPAVAVGELVSHPTGLARLELRAPGGLVERHILLGNQHSAARNARVLVRPRAFLPPLFVLQSDSGTVLDAALGTLGVDRRTIGLAPCGENDCYVIGDPTRAVRKPRFVPAAEADAETAAAQASDEAHAEERFFPALWVDTVDHQIRAVESRAGVRVTLGPYVKFEQQLVPLWWTIDEPGKRQVRFEVEGCVEVNAPAAAFSKSWLMTPGIEDRPPTDQDVTSTSLEPLPPTPAVSGGPLAADLEELGFDDRPDAGAYEGDFG